MAPPKLKPEKDDAGRYLTDGLSEKTFQQIFRLIEQEQRKNRRSAKRTLTPSALRAKSDLAKLGEKSKGVPFTREDLLAFEKTRKKHKAAFNSSTAGITYDQLVAGSRDIDIKRANNKVDDNSGITTANLSGINGNIILVRVKASGKSVHQDHMVKVRLEQFDDLIQEPPGDNFITAAKVACAGRLSFNCDCGRHQYWYRYLATMGNYAVSPPKEFAFPKVRNPEMKGVACKHVLKTVAMMQSATWHPIIATQMKKAAKRVGYGDDRKFNHVLTDKELKQSRKNRSTKVNQAKAKAAFEKYSRNIKAFDKQLKTQSKEIKKIREQANRLRKQSETIKKKDQQLSQAKDLLKMSFVMFADQYTMAGKSRDDAINTFAKKVGMTPSKLKGILK